MLVFSLEGLMYCIKLSTLWQNEKLLILIHCFQKSSPANVENIVSKGEIRFEQFLLLSLCFQKAVCCRGVRKRPFEGKDTNVHTVRIMAAVIKELKTLLISTPGSDESAKPR